MNQPKTLHAGIVEPETLHYLDQRIRLDGRVNPSDHEDVRQDIVLAILMNKDRLWPKQWKGFISKTVKNAIANRHRQIERSGGEEIAATDRGITENGTPVYDRDCDKFFQQFADMREQGIGDADDTDSLTRTERLDRLFGRICRSFRALNENPESCWQGDPWTVLPILDAAVTSHLTPKEAETWRAIWKIVRSEYPTPSQREIAKRVGCDKNTVAKAMAKWTEAAADFRLRWAHQWLQYTDQQKLDFLRGVVNGIIDHSLAEAQQLKGNLDRERFGFGERRFGPRYHGTYPDPSTK